MFEKETKFIYDFSMNQIKQLGSYITFEELAGSNLHPAIIRYVSAEIEYLIYEDRQRLLNGSNFDYSGEEVSNYFVLITKHIKGTRKFSLDYIGNIILHAISFSLNYLAQPNWSLIKLIFAKNSVLKSSEVLQILKYVYFYNYIPNLVEKYILKKNLLSVSKSELESVLLKSDKEIFAGSTSSKLLDNILLTIGEFANIGSFSKTKVPILIFELFLKEKKLDEYWEKLDHAFAGEVKQVYEIPEIQKILYSPSNLPAESKKNSYMDKLLNQENPLSIFGKETKKTDKDEKLLQNVDPDIPVLDGSFNTSATDIVDKNIVEKEDTETGNRDIQKNEFQNKEPEELQINTNIPSVASEEVQAEKENINENSQTPDKGFQVEQQKDKTGIIETSEHDLPLEQDRSLENDLLLDNVAAEGEEEIELDLNSEEDFVFLEEESVLNPETEEKSGSDLAENPNDLAANLGLQEEFLDFELNSEVNLDIKDEERKIDDQSIYDEIAESLSDSNDLNDKAAGNEVLKDNSGRNLNEDSLNDADETLGIPSLEEKNIEDELEQFFSHEDSFEDQTLPEVSLNDIPESVLSNLSEQIPSIPLEEDQSISNLQGADLDAIHIENLEHRGDISDYFTQREMHKVISTVFNDNIKSLTQTFDALSRCKNIGEAEKVLNSVVVTNQVSPNAKGIKIIKKKLLKYFNQV
ncbi:MAG: hypothetical protein ACM3MI_13535 [Clostridiales bacterium]